MSLQSYHYQKLLDHPHTYYNKIVEIMLQYHAQQQQELKRLNQAEQDLLLREIQTHFNDVIPFIHHFINQPSMLEASPIPPDKRVYYYCMLLPLIQLTYANRQFPNAIFWETISDLFLRIHEYYQIHHSFSFSDEIFNWLSRIFSLSIFKIGELQFEIIQPQQLTLDSELQIHGPTYAEMIQESYLINVHIMEASLLTPATLMTSFSTADDFFSHYFPQIEYHYYCCYSWLLFPPMLDLLKPDSHIRHFYHFFEIVASSPNRQMALQRIFKVEQFEKLSLDKLNTHLQMQAFHQPNKLGLGLGIRHR